MPKEGLDLTVGKSYADMVNVNASQCTNRKLVLPGDPANSYMMQKMLGVSICSGTQMPKAGASIPSNQLQAIANWICQGALNN
jgi:hypothetical protein